MKHSQQFGICGELITCKSASGRDLDGILYREPDSSTTVIHIHGSFGNFYQNPLVRQMAQVYRERGINLLSVNTSCHDGLGEGYGPNGKFAYIGGAISPFGECVSDIAGAIDFVKPFSRKTVLQGHSLGCDRVVHFLITTKAKHDFILLSPCDSYQLQCCWISPETVEQQIARLKREPPFDPLFDWLPSREYGVKGPGDWTYAIPITRPALLSIMEGPPYKLFRVSNPAKFFLKQSAFVCIGGSDALQSWPQDTMFKYLQERISEVTALYLPDADHMIAKHESRVATKIIDWLGLRPTK